MSSKEKLLASAQKNLLKGQIAKAIKDYQQMVELDPKDIRNRQKLAELYCRAGMNAEALGEYGMVATYYGDNGFYLKAIAVYKQMQKVDPEQINVYHRLAELNIKQGLVGNALAEYRNLVAFFEKNKRLPDAIAVLQKMSELEPENLNLLVKIAEYHAQAGLRDKAREEFTQVLNLLHKAEEFSRIVKLYEIFLFHFPDDPEIKVGFAEALIRKGDPVQGLQMLKSLLRENAENSRVLRALAQAYRECDDFENERLTYHHLLKQSPGDLELREAFVRAFLDGGEYLRALAELEEWKDAFFDAGRTLTLKVLYEDLQEYLPDNEQIHRVLTLVYEQTGDGANRVDTAIAPNPPAGSVVALNESDISTAPLESFESSAEALDPLILEGTPGMPPEPPRVEIVPETINEEMDFELELVLDDPLMEYAPTLDAQGPDVGADVVLPTPADLAALETAEVLEELVELDPAVDLDVPATEELLEELEVLSDPDADVDLPGAADEGASEGGFAGFEPGEVSTDIGSLADPVKNVRDELEEAEFYLQQGLLDDAERVCRQILEIDPGCSGAREKLAELALRRRTNAKVPAEYAPFDLPEKASAVEVQPGPDQLTVPGMADRVSHDEVFDEFRIAVDTPIDVEDTETHYNLGIAYKEMGLLDEAVAEFDKAMRNPGRMVDSLTLKGTCLLAKGDFALAERVFKSGLVYPGLNTAERVSLYYEMGLLYEVWARPLEALDSYQSAANIDLFFRDVGEKIEALRRTLGLDVNAGKEDTGAGGNRSRVSYI